MLNLLLLERVDGIQHHFVIDEIKALEGLGPATGTKPAAEFSRARLRGLWHKHFFVPMVSSMGYNIAQANRSLPGKKRQLSILIADDNADTITMLSALLHDDGHIVHTCMDALIAVESIRRYAPEVCILDVVMPGKSGYQIAREVRSLEGRQPVLIAISGEFKRPVDQLLARSVGFDHFFAKGDDPAALLDIINGLAESGPPSLAA